MTISQTVSDKQRRRKQNKRTLPVPLESDDQAMLFQWAKLIEGKYPELRWMYAIPNGGSRHLLEAIHLKEQGVKPGVPDLCLPIPRGGYHALYIELKRQKGGKLSEEQSKWIEHLRKQGYAAKICLGFYEAVDTIQKYLDSEDVAP